jgi:hypothetical protein
VTSTHTGGNTPQPEPEKPRFLLPDDCSDLIDVLRSYGQIDEGGSSLSAPPPCTDLPQSLPKSVALPDPLGVRELASALHIEPFQVIGSLMQLSVYCSLNAPLNFDTASSVCAKYGVVATKVAF